MSHTYSNKLLDESSPYLLQHAHNPVDWFPWGDEAIRKARAEDKPILVSIGYSACHWCHVMERESFEDPDTAELMNREFVNIKIDREERPDLDQIYMDAVQAMAGNGGWPLNVFLTPEAKPFFGGTYFPPTDIHNRPSWKSVLQQISQAFKTRRAEIEAQADELTRHIAGSGFNIPAVETAADFPESGPATLFQNLLKTADRREGGFGQAPKFPQTFSIRFLLQYYQYTGNTVALEHACLSLEKMIHGGIYDQLGGGFSRYSTDAAWLAPHFEKMLYDNALIISALSEAYQVTGKVVYRQTILDTIGFIEREMRSPAGGYYGALDADSDGTEGKFYVWQKEEIDTILGKGAEEFCRLFDVTEAGNWEGVSILRVLKPEAATVPYMTAACKQALLARRAERVRPGLDDKILLGWNALLITAFCKAFAALGDVQYRDLAIRTMEFLEENLRGDGINYFYHSHKDGKSSIPAFLDDYAFVIEAYIQLQEITGEASYLERARTLTDWVIVHFSEADTGFFYYTHAEQDDVIVRKREIYDGATPSGNAVMAFNLLYLGTVFDVQAWKERASGNVAALQDLVQRYPGSFGVWATLLNGFTYQLNEVVLAGSYSDRKIGEFLAKFIPNRVFQVTSVAAAGLPLLRNKPPDGPSQFFLCRNYSCQQPVKEVAELLSLIKNS